MLQDRVYIVTRSAATICILITSPRSSPVRRMSATRTNERRPPRTMPASRRKTFWRPLRRRLCAGITLVAYLLTALGVPLPAATRKDADQPFPCQDHPCGCQTAEQCWASCCCFSPEERLAWAQTHNVTPPDYAEKPAGRGWRTTRLRDREQGPGKGQHSNCPNCARQGTHPAPPAAPHSCKSGQPNAPDCGQTPKPCCQEKSTGKGNAPSDLKTGVRWGLGVAALRCKGQTTEWAATGAVLPPAPPLTWSPCLPAVAWLTGFAESPLVLASAPREPPPRPPHA
jgi:hypothetical protein